MNDWAELAVEGHFHAEKPWWDYQERFANPLSKIVGAKPNEIAVMNTLTVNLHLLMVSFYRPKGKRIKIICEEKAFPSDQYLLQSQVRHHGLDPKETIVEVKRRKGEHNIRLEDVLTKIEEVGDQLALVFIGGLNYYTGQVFDMKTITTKGHSVGALVGWDLAHAVGNIKLELNKWNVDFAAWCSYKYMNSGPGNAAGIFVHQKHHNSDLPRFAGWYGHNKERRFLMESEFEPMQGAEGWQISNLPILSLAPYLASVEMFDEIGMDNLIEKRNKITAYLEFVLERISEEVDRVFEVITPKNKEERGSQLSVFIHGKGKELFDYLQDVYNFGQILKNGITEK